MLVVYVEDIRITQLRALRRLRGGFDSFGRREWKGGFWLLVRGIWGFVSPLNSFA